MSSWASPIILHLTYIPLDITHLWTCLHHENRPLTQSPTIDHPFPIVPRYPIFSSTPNTLGAINRDQLSYNPHIFGTWEETHVVTEKSSKLNQAQVWIWISGVVGQKLDQLCHLVIQDIFNIIKTLKKVTMNKMSQIYNFFKYLFFQNITPSILIQQYQCK